MRQKKIIQQHTKPYVITARLNLTLLVLQNERTFFTDSEEPCEDQRTNKMILTEMELSAKKTT